MHNGTVTTRCIKQVKINQCSCYTLPLLLGTSAQVVLVNISSPCNCCENFFNKLYSKIYATILKNQNIIFNEIFHKDLCYFTVIYKEKQYSSGLQRCKQAYKELFQNSSRPVMNPRLYILVLLQFLNQQFTALSGSLELIQLGPLPVLKTLISVNMCHSLSIILLK